MPIPTGTFYHDEPFSSGTVSTIDQSTVNSEVAGSAIKFGQAVVMSDGKAVPATSAPIYGVALKRGWVNADKLTQENIDADTWLEGETVSVLREGTVAVPLSADVKHGDNATVDANGLFKTAAAGDKVVGVFLDDGNKDKTVSLQVRISLDNPLTNVAK